MNNTAGRRVLDCLDGLPTPCVDLPGKTIADRVLDVEAIMNNIGAFLGDGVDSSQVAVSATHVGASPRWRRRGEAQRLARNGWMIA